MVFGGSIAGRWHVWYAKGKQQLGTSNCFVLGLTPILLLLLLLLLLLDAKYKGKLGHGNENGHSTPKRVEALVGLVVSMIACGSRHTAVVTSPEGNLYTW